MADPTKWVTETPDGHSQRYIARFREMAADGADLAGEARLIDAMTAPGSRVLDAGCGTGRVGAELAKRGHAVVGIDADPELIAAAIEDFADCEWLVADLTELDGALIAGAPLGTFDAVVVAGNVMAFAADGTQADVLRQLRARLEPGGFIAVGFGTGRGYEVAEFDRDVADAGLRVDSRFSTWDLKPWDNASDFSVSVLRG